jgi:hypothetical protein
MSRTIRARHLIAVIAAYVVALQALLLPLSVAAGSPFATTLCAAAASDDGAPSPSNHDSGCPCAAGCGMQCCAQTFVGPAQITLAPGVTRAVTMTLAPVLEPVVRMADRGPQIPRAPPAA